MSSYAKVFENCIASYSINGNMGCYGKDFGLYQCKEQLPVGIESYRKERAGFACWNSSAHQELLIALEQPLQVFLMKRLTM